MKIIVGKEYQGKIVESIEVVYQGIDCINLGYGNYESSYSMSVKTPKGILLPKFLDHLDYHEDYVMVSFTDQTFVILP